MIHTEVKPVSHDAAHHAHPHHPHHHDAKGFVRAVEHASEERGLRLTPLRKEVLELIAAAHKPIASAPAARAPRAAAASAPANRQSRKVMAGRPSSDATCSVGGQATCE